MLPGCCLLLPRTVWMCPSPSASSYRASIAISDHSSSVLNFIFLATFFFCTMGLKLDVALRHSLKPGTMLLLSQPRMLLAIPAPGLPVCAQLSPRPCSAELFPRQTSPSQFCCQQLFLPMCSTWHFSLLSFHFHCPIPPASAGLGWQPCPQEYHLSSPDCVLPVWSHCAPVFAAHSIAGSPMTLHRASPRMDP